MFKLRGLSISAICYGNKSKPPLVALHGWLDNAASFDLLGPLIENYCVYAIDLPGHGHSAHLPPYCYYHLIDAVSHVLALIEQINPGEPIALMGHSLGACIASMAAGASPQNISQLILIDGLGPLTYQDDEALKKYQKYIKMLGVLDKKPTRFYETVDEAAKTRASNSDLSIEFSTIIVKRGLKETEDGYTWRHDDRLLLPSAIRFNETQVLNFLENIDMPSLMISASNGFPYQLPIMHKRINTVKTLQHETVEGGHHIHMEAPQRCAKLINTFLK